MSLKFLAVVVLTTIAGAGVIIHPYISAQTQSCCGEADFATCTGSENCTACKSCSSCKHCSKNGGTCGACAKQRE